MLTRVARCPLRGLILAVLPLRLSYDLGSGTSQALRTQSTDPPIEIGSSLPACVVFSDHSWVGTMTVSPYFVSRFLRLPKSRCVVARAPRS